MKRYLVLAVLAIAIAFFVVRCTTPEASLRYRIVVEVETPSGLKSGMAVQELVLLRQRLFPLPGAGGADWGGGYMVVGEAPFVDLGDGKVLFAALHDARYGYEQMMTSVAFRAFDISNLRRLQPDASDANILGGLESAKTTYVLQPEHYPTLAMFNDMADPKSLVELSPDSFKARFGSGYAISRITFQAVDRATPLTATVTERFPALARERGLLTLPAP